MTSACNEVPLVPNILSYAHEAYVQTIYFTMYSLSSCSSSWTYKSDADCPYVPRYIHLSERNFFGNTVDRGSYFVEQRTQLHHAVYVGIVFSSMDEHISHQFIIVFVRVTMHEIHDANDGSYRLSHHGNRYPDEVVQSLHSYDDVTQKM